MHIFTLSNLALKMFWHFFCLVTILATLSKNWANFPPPHLLVALIPGKTTGSIMSGSAKVCPRLCAKNCNVEGDQIGHLSLIDLLSEAHDDFFEKMK